MNIAVAREGAYVSGHFGHCSDFNIFTAEDGKITEEERLVSPGHDHNLIEFLNDRGVNVIISGGRCAGKICCEWHPHHNGRGGACKGRCSRLPRRFPRFRRYCVLQTRTCRRMPLIYHQRKSRLVLFVPRLFLFLIV